MRKSLRTLVSPLFFLMSLLMGSQVFALSAKEDIQLIPQLPAQGNFDVTFHPGKTVTKGESVQVQFGVPLPVGVLTDTTKISLKLNGVEVPIAAKEIVYWNPTDTRTKSIRSVLITTDITFADIAPKNGVLTYGVARTANYTKTIPSDPTASWVPISQETYPTEFSSAANIKEPSVYTTFAPQWLEKSLLRTRSVPLGENPALAWWDQGMIEFGKTFVNDVSSYVTTANRINYETSAGVEVWLFDRAQTLYGTYIRTGDVKWLRHAHRNAQFYKNNIEADGQFKLKKALDPYPDLKYAYGQSMLLNLIFTGDQSNVTPVKNVATFAAGWNYIYSYTTNFFTERHQTYALLGALSAWEVTGEAAYLTRAQTIVQSTLSQTRSPVNGWQPNGCLLHTMEAHEGDPNKSPVCSPWMSTMLMEAVFKYYIHTKDPKALELISEYGGYVEKYATFQSTDPHWIPSVILPYYMASSVVTVNENGDWAAREHTCDVGALAARGAWAKKALGQSYASLRKLASDYLAVCQPMMNDWHREGADVNYGKSVWRVTPGRQYSWEYGATLDYDWLLRSIDYVDSKPMPPSNFTAVPLVK
jgi:hypothetical protein